jgi:hypothetical protein
MELEQINPNTPLEQPKQGWFRRHRKLSYFLLLPISILVILVILYFSLPTILHYVAGKDSPAPNDQDLQLKKISIPDSQNAYFDLIKLSDKQDGTKAEIKMTSPQGFSSIDIVNGKGWNQTLVEQAIEQNGAALDIFSAAAEKPKYQEPLNADPALITLDRELIAMNGWREAARLSVIKSELLSRQGKGLEAMDEALKSVKVGYLMEESQATLINYLVGMAIKNSGLKMVQQNLRFRQYTNDELNNYAQILEQYKGTNEGIKNAFKGEYKTQTLAIDAITQHPDQYWNDDSGLETEKKKLVKKTYNHWLFKPNQTKNIFADYTKGQIIKADQGFCIGTENVDLLAPQPTNIFNAISLPLTENIVGKTLHDVIAVSLDSVFTKKCSQDALFSIVQLNIALKKYANTNAGLFPNTLNELVPVYISSIPNDPFDSKPLKYSRSKLFIYSVGQDLTDSGGSASVAGKDWSQLPDITFKFSEQ